MKTMLIIAAILTAVASSPATAKTVDRADLDRIRDCMMRRTCQNTLLMKDYRGDFARQVVFEDGGKRYTFVLWGNNSLSIWVRPKGTTDQASVSTFTDELLDGVTDFGTNDVRRPHADRKYFSIYWDNVFRSEGLEFRDYWNERYAETISAAVRKLCPAPAH